MAGEISKQIAAVFRYDDYSSREALTEFEIGLLQVFKEAGVPFTVGVVPCVTPVDEELTLQEEVPLTFHKAKYLKDALEAGALEVALHGYSHQTILSRANGGWTEFYGLDYDAQVERISKGKRLLETMLGINITTFIPPWNSYDSNTLRALNETGFNCISAGRRGPTLGSSHLRFLPWTCSVTEVREAVQAAKASSDGGPVITVLLHAYDFTEISTQKGVVSLRDLAQLLSWLKHQPSARVCTIGQVAENAEHLDAQQFKNYSYFTSPIRRRLKLPFLQQTPSFYPSPGSLRTIIRRDKLVLTLGGFSTLGSLLLIGGLIVNISGRWGLSN